jgi:hypothetical protein
MTWLRGLSWPLVLFACVTFGLSPFRPPHVVEKVQMLLAGTLARPLDWFDLALHGTPWVLLGLKAAVTLLARRGRGEAGVRS